MTDREIMQQALEALDCLQPSAWEISDRMGADTDKTITALRARLAQPEQEPVAWMSKVVSHYEELRRIIDNGSESMTHEDAVEYLKELVKLNERPYKPEPVAWLYRDSWGTMKLSQVMPPPVGAFPVYTTPPRREWVGLEPHDMPDGEDPIYDDPRFIAGMVWAAKKLMEKNG